jgi:menaquinone-dependent protoporphyrinogen IX oxidase
MSKTLIVYGTRFGATEKSSEVIAGILKENFNHEVDVIKLSSQSEDVDYTKYDTIIIGSSLAMFSWTKRPKKFLKNDFTGKKVFVFISSAALTYQAKLDGDMEKYEKWKRRFLDNIVNKRLNVKPVSTMVLGGWIKNNKGEYDLNNWNEEDAISWAEEIGQNT